MTTAATDSPTETPTADEAAAAAAAAAAANKPAGDKPAGETPAAGDKPAAETKPEAKATESAAPATTVVVPEKYELTLPENAPFSQADLDAIALEARAMSCTQEEAQALVNARVQHSQALAAQYLTELKADPELGGAKFDESVALSLKGRSIIAPEGTDESAFLNKILDQSGAGNHRLIVKMFARLGRLASEDLPGLGKAQGDPPKTGAQRMYPNMNP
jgi:hypothetical protein